MAAEKIKMANVTSFKMADIVSLYVMVQRNRSIFVFCCLMSLFFQFGLTMDESEDKNQDENKDAHTWLLLEVEEEYVKKVDHGSGSADVVYGEKESEAEAEFESVREAEDEFESGDEVDEYEYEYEDEDATNKDEDDEDANNEDEEDGDEEDNEDEEDANVEDDDEDAEDEDADEDATIKDGDDDDYDEDEVGTQCREQGVDKVGQEIRPGRPLKTETGEQCEKRCKSTVGCSDWTWYAPGYRVIKLRRSCYLWSNVSHAFRDFDTAAYLISGNLDSCSDK